MAEQHTSTLLEQWVNRTVWMDGCDLETEERQAREEGRDLSTVEEALRRLQAVPRGHGTMGGARDADWLRQAGALVDQIQALPCRADFPYQEPNGLAGIRAARSAAPALPVWEGDTTRWQERLHGGLLGRIAGCLLGKPVECWPRSALRAVGEATGNWPLTDYWRRQTAGEAAELDRRGVTHRFGDGHAPMLRGGIDGMIEDDDINYTAIGFAVVRRFGADFTPLDVAQFWCDSVPILHTCTAERVAYRNFVGSVLPPDSASHRNPYREWIGAQIRADYFGYANPGDPERAAEWAWRDASISHVRNGIYGEMWVAAMLAAAFVETDWVRIVRAGLAQIPARCRLHADVEKIIAAYDGGASYEQTVEAVHSQWDEKNAHDWCHTNSNAQVVTLGLLYGEDCYETTITRAVMAGFDTDCNGATCGSLWGVRFGLSALPEKWTAPLRDRVRTGVHGYFDTPISALAAAMLETAVQARR